ncbi:MAG: ComEA family DNA-binding protein [Actinophytocola sp.]|uniref:ComEA family DNA-binding protein n=1 Tax=Actinophytocola sp. TaxID=1872138 RepID=UPI003D6AF284
MTDTSVAPRGGRWYFVVAIASMGLFAWVPFLHAAARLDRPGPRRLALLFGAVAAAVAVWASVSPDSEPVSGAWALVDGIAVVIVIAAIAIACVRLVPLRREVYGGGPASSASASDAALANALGARERRDAARAIAAGDPLLARDLRIGRPDLRGDYDDGGLVELNTAPEATIATLCGLPAELAARIVAAREECGGFLAVDDVFSLVYLPMENWNVVRDRGVLIA